MRAGRLKKKRVIVMILITSGTCLALTILYICWADVALVWKGVVVLLYVATCFIDRLFPTGFPIGFLLQVVLCL